MEKFSILFFIYRDMITNFKLFESDDTVVYNGKKYPKSHVLIFDDAVKFFDDDYPKLVDFLNSNMTHKNCDYISDSGTVYVNFQIRSYELSQVSKRIKVRTTSGQWGDPMGLIFNEPTPLSGKKFKRIERPDIDPLGEDDWGYEEIED